MQLIKSFQNASAQTRTEANIRINETAILTKRALGLGRFATDHSHKGRFATFVRSCQTILNTINGRFADLPFSKNHS